MVISISKILPDSDSSTTLCKIGIELCNVLVVLHYSLFSLVPSLPYLPPLGQNQLYGNEDKVAFRIQQIFILLQSKTMEKNITSFHLCVWLDFYQLWEMHHLG
jgi:hypothetical protein